MNTVRFSALLLFVTSVPAVAQLQYVPLQTPCRAVDTRQAGGALADDSIQVFDPGKACGIPSQGNNPIVFAINVTVVPHGGLGALTVYGTGVPTPNASTLNSYDGRVKSDYALVAGGVGTGDVSVWASNATDVILDVSGYFTLPPATGPAMLYTPVTPCRLVDTRTTNTPIQLGQVPFFSAEGKCGLPSLPGMVLSVNVTAIPQGPLGYLEVWGTPIFPFEYPTSSTLNSPTGTVVANAAFLNVGSSGSFAAISSSTTDLVVDVTGYFSEGTTGLAYYPMNVPTRILDTRTSIDPNGGGLLPTGGLPFTGELTQGIGQGVDVLNATVVPSAPLWVLTLYPDGVTKPVVSTLNSYDATVTSNMAIVSAGADGSFDAFAEGGPTQLILDLSGSFMPLPTGGPSVVFIGDDAIADWASSSPAFAQNPNWINKGVVGQTSGQVSARFQSDVINLHPAIVNIVIGINDVATPNWNAPCGGNNQATATCANLDSMVQMATAAGIKVIVGTMPVYGTDPSSVALGNSELFDRGLRQDVGIGASPISSIFSNPNVALVDYGMVSDFTPGSPGIVSGYSSMTTIVQDMISLFEGVTVKSGYLGNPGNINTAAVGGTIPFTAYGVYSDGNTRAVSPYVYYGGAPGFATSNSRIMQINPTTGYAIAESPGQVSISVSVDGVGFSPWIVNVQ